MDAITPWLTPALLVALFAWLRLDIRELRRDLNQRMDKTETRIDDLGKDVDKRLDDVNERFDKRLDDVNERFDKRFDDVNKRFDDVNKRFDDVNKRFDDVNRELADQRERMAKLEDSLEGFLAGRRDRDAA